ncbi:MAG: hypothetical protein NC913_06060 [Candidatus Omnitrophica bacterium]|nr:hypothetical protein [Candidatus Omnitrophota bacterium]
MKKYGWANKGDALIFSIAVVLLLFIITVGFLIIFGHWEKSSFLMFSGVQSDHAAKIGIEQAIWELRNDKNNYDGYDEPWCQKFSGDEIDIDGDGIKESKFFYVKNFRGKIVARYAVLVTDESGSININYVKNLSKNGNHGFNEGWTTFEIAFFPGLCDSIANKLVEFRRGIDLKPGKSNVDDDNDNAILSDDGIDNDGDGFIDGKDEGIDEEDEFNHKKPQGDDRPFFVIEDIKMVYGMTEKLFEKIKNHITCHSYDLNIDAENYYRTNINKASVSLIASILKSLNYNEKDAIQIAVNAIDYRDKDNTPTVITTSDGNTFIGIEKTPYINEVEPAPEIRIQTIMSAIGPVTIIEELGPHFIELFNPYDETIDIGGWLIKGGMIILPSVNLSDHNQQSQNLLDEIEKGNEINQSGLIKFWKSLTVNTIKIPEGAKIKPRSFYLIGDSIKWKIIIKMTPAGPIVIPLLIPIKQPADADHYEPILFMNFKSDILNSIFSIISKIFGINFLLNGKMSLVDNKNQLIEQTDYGSNEPGKMSRQKNDPRINEWFTAIQTPGKLNFCFNPTVGGEFNSAQLFYWPASFIIKNNPFSSPAELSYIHKGKQWQTLNIWKGYDKKLLDVFTVVENVENPVFGRINVNTASHLVLTCLPLVDTDIAREIINERPFKDLSDIIGKYDGPLNRQIAKYGTNLVDDNKNTWIDTEDEKELVISKIINLITVRANVFRILVLSQKVLDSDNNGIITDKEIKAETRYRIIYDRHNNKIIERRKL